jgi:hypothetical protein
VTSQRVPFADGSTHGVERAGRLDVGAHERQGTFWQLFDLGRHQAVEPCG